MSATRPPAGGGADREEPSPDDFGGGDDDIPADIKGLVIMNPTRRIEERELRRINGYLMRGGSVAIFAPGVNVTGTTSSPTGAAAEHNLGALLSGYGVTLRDKLRWFEEPAV